MYLFNFPRAGHIGTSNLKYRKFVHVLMYLDIVGIGISNNQDNHLLAISSFQ